MATTNKKINFSYFERKQDFTPALQAELTNSIVFVEDTKEVFTHGEFFGIRGVTLNYDSSTTKLQLKDGNVVVSEMDASAFVKDDMLDNVTLVKVQETGVTEAVPYLKFVFNTGSGKAAVRVSVSDLVDTYDGANIELTSSFAEAQSYSAPAIGDSVDEAVGKLLKGHSDNVTALSGKQATIVGAATTVTLNDLTSNRALISSGSGKIAVSEVTATELGYLDGVTSAIQAQFSGKVDKVTGKGLSTNDYTDTEKNKLAAIEANANNYSLPTAAADTLGGVKVGTNLSIDGNGVLSATDTTYDVATTSADGLLSSTDKAKLNGIAAGATAVTVDAELSASSTNAIRNSAVDAGIKNAQRVFYAVTETAGATAVKEFTIPNFPTETINGVKTPLKGTILIAQCANTDTRTAQLKFKINDGGEFPIWYNTSELSATSANTQIFGLSERRHVFAFNGTHWCWASKGYEGDTQYTAGSGLALTSNQFRISVPRVVKSANSIPGVNSARIEEYQNGSGYNLPLSNQLFHILTIEGDVNTGATQLALCLTGTGVYYRFMYNSVWQPWLRLDNPTVDATPTASSTNPVQSGGTKTYVDEQVATKSSITIRQWVTE